VSTVFAGQAVRPECPRCSRPVRSGVELQAALCDWVEARALRNLPVNSTGFRIHPQDGAMNLIDREFLDQLEAELQGEHRSGPHGCERSLEPSGIQTAAENRVATEAVARLPHLAESPLRHQLTREHGSHDADQHREALHGIRTISPAG